MERCTVMVCMISVVCITCMWLAKPSCEEKAEVIASLLSGTTPAPTTTEEIISKIKWMRACGSLLLHVCIHTSSTAPANNNIHAGMLQWFIQPAVAQRVTAGGLPVSANEVYATAESLPDEAVNAELRQVQNMFLRGGMSFCHINM